MIKTGIAKKIVYLSEEQKDELFANGSVTVGDVTIEFDENDIYLTPQTDTATGGEVVEHIDGETPTINGEDNHRYMCGWLTHLTINPPNPGTMTVFFAADNGFVLEVPNALQYMNFTEEDYETDTHYRLTIIDGQYAAVDWWNVLA